ncbi:MAG: hypothetical protein ACJARD_001681 [Alphaproteobacteria bacterium]|jgi:hypothetical protein
MQIHQEAPSKSHNIISFVIILALAFILSCIPLLRAPFSWIQTYFHEISHGIAALLTGGNVDSIQLHLIGSGLCRTIGGIRFIVVFSGYLGAIIWGALIYLIINNSEKKHANSLALTLVCMVSISAIFWGRDLITLAIMGIIIIIFLAVLKLKHNHITDYFLRFLGLYVLLDAIKSPLYLIDGRPYGDGHSLAELTFIPEIIWIFIWVILGISVLYFLWRGHIKG